MLRLVQGDVGSGKTAVAAWALAAAAPGRRQGALLAPTDLLARQHLETVGGLLEDLGIGVTLLTGSLRRPSGASALEAHRARARRGSSSGRTRCSRRRSRSRDLGLVVVDEQHASASSSAARSRPRPAAASPHVLLMTATPIPRTLGQVLYADLDVSDLRTPPAGRVPIRTGIRRPDDLDGTWRKVREEAAAGPSDVRRRARSSRRAPTDVDDDDGAGRRVAAEARRVRLRELLAPLRVGLVHGRMKPADRDAEMARFRDGDLDVLVGTTVVEVGVDVPEATMMVVEGADRFGLAQLHQLRGRVGRGTVESFCVLVSDAADEIGPGAPEGRRRAARRVRAGGDATSSCAARATSSGSPRAACRACASRR